jgi:hypothetical protein
MSQDRWLKLLCAWVPSSPFVDALIVRVVDDADTATSAKWAPTSRPVLPLIVYTRGKSEDDGPDSKANAAERFKEHEAVARMSTRGKHLVAAKSGHHIQIEEPELVVAAVREVLGAIKR